MIKWETAINISVKERQSDVIAVFIIKTAIIKKKENIKKYKHLIVFKKNILMGIL